MKNKIFNVLACLIGLIGLILIPVLVIDPNSTYALKKIIEWWLDNIMYVNAVFTFVLALSSINMILTNDPRTSHEMQSLGITCSLGIILGFIAKMLAS